MTGIALALGLGGIVLVFLTPEHDLPIKIANGSYAARCCGVMVLQDGVIHIRGYTVGYRIQQDKVGPYISPTAFVGESSTRYIVDFGATPLKLRLDDKNRATQIELDRGSIAKMFEE
jgi:hypothetical protein